MNDAVERDESLFLSEPTKAPRMLPPLLTGIDAAELFGDVTPSSSPVAPARASPPSSTVPPPLPSVSSQGSPQEPPPRASGARQVAVPCPICATRAIVSDDLIGSEIRCSDCHSTFIAVAQRAKRAKPAVDSIDPSAEFRLSETFDRPKYEPMTRGHVDPGDLEVAGRSRVSPDPGPCDSGPSDQGESKRPVSRVVEEFSFPCPTCGTKLLVQRDQIGTSTICGDCRTEITIPERVAKRRRTFPTVADDGNLVLRADTASELVAPPLPGAVSGTSAVESRPAPGKLSPANRALIEKAMNDKRESLRATVPLAKLAYPTRMVGFLFSGGVLLRGMYLSVGLCILLSFVHIAWMAIVQEVGLTSFVAIIMLPFAAFITVPTLVYWANAAIVVVQDTANGGAQVDGWDDDLFIDMMSQLLTMVIVLMASTTPGVVLTVAATSAGIPVYWMPVAMAISMWLFFPFVLLSVLEGGHAWDLASASVARTFQTACATWIRYYAESFVLVIIGSGFAIASVHSSLMVRAIGAVGLVATSFVSARALGLAAARASLTFEPQVEGDGQATDHPETKTPELDHPETKTPELGT